jgi:membrane dipeptidase
MFLALAFAVVVDTTVLDNAYVRVTRDGAPCAGAAAWCGDRVIVAADEVVLPTVGGTKTLKRGEIAVFATGTAYKPPTSGHYWEVAWKAKRPATQWPREQIRPSKNEVLFENANFFAFEERLAVGDTRPRHSHAQRVVIQLNKTQLHYWFDDAPETTRDITPDRPAFNEPTVHITKTVGDLPLRGIVLELKPARSQMPDSARARAMRALTAQPIIDGHNDLPWRIREDTVHPMDVVAYDISKKTPGHTDLARLKAGKVGAQFWSVYIPGEKDEAAYKARGGVESGIGYSRVQMEQIDIARRVIAMYPQLMWTPTADSARLAISRGRVGSMLGMEGGHAIENSLSLLRLYYDLGARYMTLTHNVTLDWADAALDSAKHGGLTPFGVEVVHEMNRLGMMLDLSHVSPGTMSDALDATVAPVIFSHSGARALVDHKRNVPDSILARVPKNGGVVMVPFVPAFTSTVVKADDDSIAGKDAAAVAAWRSAHPRPRATIEDIANVVDHVRKVAGVDHVGIGSDFDGISETPVGLEDVSKFPDLFIELARRGWSVTDMQKLAGGNVLRVFKAAEVVSARLRKERGPSQASIEQLDGRRPIP